MIFIQFEAYVINPPSMSCDIYVKCQIVMKVLKVIRQVFDPISLSLFRWLSSQRTNILAKFLQYYPDHILFQMQKVFFKGLSRREYCKALFFSQLNTLFLNLTASLAYLLGSRAVGLIFQSFTKSGVSIIMDYLGRSTCVTLEIINCSLINLLSRISQ